MKKIMIMMVMMLTIVVSTSGKNNTNYDNHDRGTSWRGKKVVCKCKCHRNNTCCNSHNRPCKKCYKMMKKGTHPYIR